MRCHRGLHQPHVPPCRRVPFRHFHSHLNPLRTPRIQVVSRPPDFSSPIDQNHHLWTANTANEGLPDTTTTPASSTLFDTDIPHAAPPPNGFDASYKREKLLLERNLEFNAGESRIIKAIRLAETWMNQQRHQQGKPTRVTAYLVGAWVRDKILGLHNSHMNLVLDNCDPVEFAQTMIEVNGFRYKGKPLMELETHPPYRHKGSVYKWAARVWAIGGTYDFRLEKPPMATLIFFVAKYKLTIIGLRVHTEGEAKDSILPDLQENHDDTQIQRTIPDPKSHSSEGKGFPAGTIRRQNLWLSQDAISRDLTINAIYITLNPIQLLDPTKRAFQDMQDRLIRTARSPVQTMLDEPRRVIRMITLAGRLRSQNFRLDPKIIETISQNPAVRAEFEKISFAKTAKRALDMESCPPYVFRLLYETNLWHLLFWPQAGVAELEGGEDVDMSYGIDANGASSEEYFQRLGGRDLESSPADTSTTFSSQSAPSTTVSETDISQTSETSTSNTPETETRGASITETSKITETSTISADSHQKAEPQLETVVEPEPDTASQSSQALDDTTNPSETSTTSPTSTDLSPESSSSHDTDTRPIYTPADLPTSNHSYLASTFFVHKLVSNFDLWAHFEEPLLFNPTVPYRPRHVSAIGDLNYVQSQISIFAFGIAAVTPWLRHPCRPPPDVPHLSMAGWVLAGWFKNPLWRQIDGFYAADEEVMRTLEEAMGLEIGDAWEFKRRHGKFWAGKVLAGAVFRWCGMCEGRIEEAELEQVWRESESYWMDMGRVVGNIHWEFEDEERQAMAAQG